jgi:hypothetical protein
MQWLRAETREKEVMSLNPMGRKDGKKIRTLDFFRFGVCRVPNPNTWQTLKLCRVPARWHTANPAVKLSTAVCHLFFYRLSRLIHGKASPCTYNLAVSKGKVHRKRIYRVFFAVSNTRQNLLHIRFGFCRVRLAHGEILPSDSGRL